jgi:hypothetical protein
VLYQFEINVIFSKECLMSSTIVSICCLVVSRPTLNLNALLATFLSIFIASNIFDGFNSPAWQQAPVLASKTWLSLNMIQPLYSSLPVKETLHVFGSRSSIESLERPLKRRFSLPNSSYFRIR